jgi:hypothetical protein
VRARDWVVILVGVALVAAGLGYYLVSTATGTVAIQVRDVPADWSRVTVTFSQVGVHPANGNNESDWVYLNLTETRIDFLSLGNLTRLLALDRIAPGTYTQIRIIVASVEGVPTTGAPVMMSVPDGVLKTTTPFTLRGGGTTTVTLDLDLARSIRQANGVWIFTPVLGQVNVT